LEVGKKDSVGIILGDGSKVWVGAVVDGLKKISLGLVTVGIYVDRVDLD
jgi:hypothetical protein